MMFFRSFFVDKYKGLPGIEAFLEDTCALKRVKYLFFILRHKLNFVMAQTR